MKHCCHVPGCKTIVSPKYLMCAVHWSQVPSFLKGRVYAEYRKGQEHTKTPTPEYLKAARDAIKSVSNTQDPDSSFVQKNIIYTMNLKE